MHDELAQQMPKVALAEDHEVPEAFVAHRLHKPLRVRVAVRAAGGNAHALAAASSSLAQDAGVVTNNLFFASGDDVPYVAIPGNIQDFIDDGGVLGELEPGSPAVDAGTADHDVYPTDIYANPRDAAPDIGAVELQQ